MPKFLLVEDEKMISLSMKAICEETFPDIIMEIAENGLEGLEKTRLWKPELIITDINMPIMDGITFIREIKKQGIKTPIIVTSGYIDSSVHKELNELGISNVFSKPVNINLFVQLIKEFISKTKKII